MSETFQLDGGSPPVYVSAGRRVSNAGKADLAYGPRDYEVEGTIPAGESRTFTSSGFLHTLGHATVVVTKEGT